MNRTGTLHLVYATPQTPFDKIIMRLFKRRISHPAWYRHAWPIPIKAPLSITYQIARHFSENYRVKLYDLKERVTIKPDEGDILLGHIWPDRSSVMWRALDKNKFTKKYLIGPYNHNPEQVLWFREAVEKCDTYFAICGRHWFDTFDQSPFADLADKIVQLSMALDTCDYPFIKTRFNPAGRRRFFYIGRYGRFGDEKGVRLLEQMAEKIPGFSGGYICEGGDIKGWEKISGPTHLTPEFMVRIAADYDCFINMSRADAQATTVLEVMSWGFPVACTPESGYAEDGIFRLELDDEQKNIETVLAIQRMDDADLRRISLNNRMAVELTYSWTRFLEKLEKNILSRGVK